MVVLMPTVAWLTLGQANVFVQLALRKRPRARDLFVTGTKVIPALIAFTLANAAAQIGLLLLFVGSIAVNDDGFIYAADVGNGWIQKFAP